MTATQLERARQHYAAREWAAALSDFEASTATSMDVEDVERMAWSRIWTLAPATECLNGFELLETVALAEGRGRVAARAALEQARMHSMLDHAVVTMSCWARAAEHLDGEECFEAVLADVFASLAVVRTGDHSGGLVIAEDARTRAQLLGDTTLEALATYVMADAAAAAGDAERSRSLVDRAMTMAVSGGIDPIYAGLVTCGAVIICRALGDSQRSREWTEVADRYFKRESVCHYPGHCSVFRSESARVVGDFATATNEAVDALVLAGDWNRSWTGMAYHQLGEAEFCQGRLSEAADAFARSAEHGHDPQPGQAELLSAQGKGDAALALITRSLANPRRANEPETVPNLAAGVTLALAEGDRATAIEWSEQLTTLAGQSGSGAIHAAAFQASGQVEIVGGDLSVAVSLLRQATDGWAAADAPYAAARARVILAGALEAAGDLVQAGLEREVAKGVFERLGARLDLATLTKADLPTSSERRTFSFTDIVGSTQLLEAMGDEAWAQVLAAHDRHIRGLLADYGGTEVKHEGDGFFVSFPGEQAGVEWAVAVQRRLFSERKEHGFSPCIRIGVHCGEATPYGQDFIGRCVHETARIANAADADEILVSATTASALGAQYQESATRSIRLKGFAEAYAVIVVDWREDMDL